MAYYILPSHLLFQARARDEFDTLSKILGDKTTPVSVDWILEEAKKTKDYFGILSIITTEINRGNAIDGQFAKPIETLADLSNTITACVNRALDVATQETTSGNWTIGHDDLFDLITEEDYLTYFPLIAAELQGREEVLDLDPADHQLDMICALNYCPNYEPSREDEEQGLEYGTRKVTHPLSLAEKAERFDAVESSVSRDSFTKSPRDILEGVEDIEFHSNIYGQSLSGDPLTNAEEQVIKTYFGPLRSVVPEDHNVLVGTVSGQNAILFTQGFCLDADEIGQSFYGDLDFMNAAVLMQAVCLRNTLHLEEFVFRADPAKTANYSAELIAAIPASLHLNQQVALLYALRNAEQDMYLPLKNLYFSKSQYDIALHYLTDINTLERFHSVHPDCPSKWIKQIAPQLASRLYASLWTDGDPRMPNISLVNPDILQKKLDIVLDNAYTELMKPITLTTYAREGDPGYNSEDDDHPTVEFDVPTGVLREYLASEAPEGERPMNVEDFLDMYIWDMSEQVRYFHDSQKAKPSLDDKMKDAQQRTGQAGSKLGEIEQIAER